MDSPNVFDRSNAKLGSVFFAATVRRGRHSAQCSIERIQEPT
jgi:hypothetical protein